MTAPEREPLFTANWRRTLRVTLTFFALLLFLLLAIVGLFTKPGQAADQLVLDVAMRGQDSIEWLTKTLTQSVSMVTVAVVAAIAMLIAAFRQRFALAARAGVMVLGANLMTQVLKSFLISRPYYGIGFDLPNSFPSGHTTVLMSLALALVVVSPQRIRTAVATIASSVVSLALIVIIVSGWHRPSDIIGGILMAFMWAMALAPQEEPSPYRDGLNTGFVAASLMTLLGLITTLILGFDRLKPALSEVVAGTPSESVLMNYPIEAHVYAVGVGLGVVALAMLGIHLVVYLQTGRRRA